MIKRLVALLLVVMTVTLAMSVAMADETWYVYTRDRKTLNVREKPYGNILARLPYGSAVDVIVYKKGGWSLIHYSVEAAGTTREGQGYVSSRYLTRKKLGSAGVTVSTGVSTSLKGDLNRMNAEYRSSKTVSAFTVVSRPDRASGWVNLRWGPSTKTEVIERCYYGKELTVVAETNNWYQLEDPETKQVGFIAKQYVIAK